MPALSHESNVWDQTIFNYTTFENIQIDCFSILHK